MAEQSLHGVGGETSTDTRKSLEEKSVWLPKDLLLASWAILSARLLPGRLTAWAFHAVETASVDATMMMMNTGKHVFKIRFPFSKEGGWPPSSGL